MKRLKYIIIFCVCHISIWAQNGKGLFFPDTLDWSKWELSLPESRRFEMLNKIDRQSDFVSRMSLPDSIKFEELVKPNSYLHKKPFELVNIDPDQVVPHFIDLDGDGSIEILFNGEFAWGDDADKQIFILKEKDGVYKQLSFLWGTIVGLSRDAPGLPVQIKSRGSYPESDVWVSIKTYSPVFSEGKLTKYECVSQLFYPEDYYYYEEGIKYLPDSFTVQIPFEVTSEQYNMRNMPGFLPDNESGNYEMFENNVVAIYPKGSLGVALAEKTDETGRVWWFVVMGRYPEPDTKAAVPMFDFLPINQLSGWMSSRYLKRLDQ